jgi:hypothetical protein
VGTRRAGVMQGVVRVDCKWEEGIYSDIIPRRDCMSDPKLSESVRIIIAWWAVFVIFWWM